MITTGRKWLALSLVLAVLVLDHVSKALILDNFLFGQRMPILPFFDLTLAFNEGIAWSFFSNMGDMAQPIFGMISLVISIAVLYFFRNEQRLVAVVGWSLVVGGALGNAIDRFLPARPGVVDFLLFYQLPVINYFPIFNFADVAINLGFAFVLYDMLFAPASRSGEVNR